MAGEGVRVCVRACVRACVPAYLPACLRACVCVCGCALYLQKAKIPSTQIFLRNVFKERVSGTKYTRIKLFSKLAVARKPTFARLCQFLPSSTTQ